MRILRPTVVLTLGMLMFAFSNAQEALAQALQITTSVLPDGVVNTPYPATTATGTGGRTPYNWQASGLPGTVSINPNTGQITGTPTSTCNCSVTLTLRDSTTPNPVTVTKTLPLNVYSPLSITTPSLQSGMVNAAYSQTLSSTGGAPTRTWSVTGNLPTGLVLSPPSGGISGTPTAAGTFSFTVRVESGSPPQTATKPLSITIAPAPLSITTTSPLPSGVINTPYSQTLAATGGTMPYTWTLASGSLPGLTVSAAGVIAGSPTATGTFNFTVRVTDNNSVTITKPLSVTITPPPLKITTTSLQSGVINTSYSQTLAATGGTTPYTWTRSGSLPAGLGLSTAGVISGTPTAAGTFNFTVQVADAGSQTDSKTFSITIDARLSITTNSSLPAGKVDVSYSQNLAATGGLTPYTWSLASGSLPGLSLSAAGLISGTPTAAGTVNFSAQVADSASQTATAAFSITVAPAALAITTASPLASGTVDVSYSRTLAATGGTTPYTWSLISGALPAGLTLSAAGVVNGAPKSAGSFNFTAQVADNGGQTISKGFSISIAPPPLSITTASPLSAAVLNAPYSQTLTASGGTTPYTWSVISGALPAGLTVSATGLIGGTPSTNGAFSFTVEVADSSPSTQRTSKTYSIQVVSVLTINANPLGSGFIGVIYARTLTAVGGSPPYLWSLAGGSLPPGITLSSTGVLSGTPISSGVFSFVARAADSGAVPQATTQGFTIVIVNPLTITSSTTLNNASTNSTYSATLSGSGGTSPYTWSLISGQLPSGLTLSSNGVLSGTPTANGDFTFSIQVTDATGTSTSKSFSLTVRTGLIIITASPLPAAVIDSSYSQQIQASLPEPLIWSLVSGNLPPGINLSSTGIISGIPIAAGAYQFTVQVVGGATQQTATQLFTLQVGSGVLITTNSILPDGTSSTAYTVSLSATGGVAPYGWTQVGGSLPDGLRLSNAGVISGTPTRTGAFTFTVQVSDSSALTATKALSISIVAPALVSFSLTGVPATVTPTQQMPIGLLLSAPQPTPLAGSLILTFASSGAPISDDPAVQFSTGLRTVNFTIPAGSTTAVFPTTVLLLTGTVSGTIVLTANMQNGPLGVPVQSIVIQPTVPQMTNVAAVRTPDGLKVQVTGYSPGRRVINVEFGFDLKASAAAQRVNLSRSVESEFSAWYRSPASFVFGSSFFFEQVFQVQGDPTMIEFVTVTLTNELGSASSVRVQIP